jgi:RNA-directed DNA polymerase
VQRFKGKVTELLDVRNKSPRGEVLRRLNQLLIEWSGYFNYGTRLQAYLAVDHHVYDRVRHFFGKRHKVQTRDGMVAALPRRHRNVPRSWCVNATQTERTAK